MATANFIKEGIKTPTSVSTVTVTLISRKVDTPTAPLYQSFVHFTVLDQNGEAVGTRQFDLDPQLTPTQKTQLKSFIDSLRVKIETEVL